MEYKSSSEIENALKQIKSSPLIKENCWQYENEWRYLYFTTKENEDELHDRLSSELGLEIIRIEYTKLSMKEASFNSLKNICIKYGIEMKMYQF
jgi:hypothetical protein